MDFLNIFLKELTIKNCQLLRLFKVADFLRIFYGTNFVHFFVGPHLINTRKDQQFFIIKKIRLQVHFLLLEK